MGITPFFGSKKGETGKNIKSSILTEPHLNPSLTCETFGSNTKPGNGKPVNQGGYAKLSPSPNV